MIQSTDRVGNGHLLGVAQAELHVGRTGPLSVLGGLGDHRRRHVQADHLARGADQPGRQQRVHARPRSNVQDDVPGPDAAESQWIAAAKRVGDGIGRHGSQVIGRVADELDQVLALWHAHRSGHTITLSTGVAADPRGVNLTHALLDLFGSWLVTFDVCTY